MLLLSKKTSLVTGKYVKNIYVMMNERVPCKSFPKKYGITDRPQGEITALTCRRMEIPENAIKNDISDSFNIGSVSTETTAFIPPVISSKA